MRVLQICSARELGGGERHLADLANALSRRGHDVFAAVVPASPLTDQLSALPPDNIVQLPLRNSLNVASALRLSRLVREQRIQIVHAHVARDYPLAALASGRTNARLVLTRHVLFPLNRIHRLTLRRTASIIAVSGAVAESLRQQRIFDPGKIVTIPNGIDVERFALAREVSQARKSQRWRVGMIGHLAPIKGPEDFIRAAAIICAQRGDVDFVIVGEDKSHHGENRGHLEQLLKDLNLTRQVRLVGWVNDISELLTTLDVFVSPARQEPFGLAIVEAMAAGVAVVATKSEGALEILEGNQSGTLVEIGEVGALASAINVLLDDPELRKHYATNGLEVVRARFALDRMVAGTENVYRAVVSER